jgi:hypothetical protein
MKDFNIELLIAGVTLAAIATWFVVHSWFGYF